MKHFNLKFGLKTLIMGILNTTPDSFSDGGRYFRCDVAVDHGFELVEQGADILDIGGESSRPFAVPVSIEEELSRVIPVIERLTGRIDIPISIDTVKAKVAEEALNAGASIINDITALEKDEKMVHLAAERGVPVILMHMKGSPATMQINPQYDDFLKEIIGYLESRAKFAVNCGIAPENIILDPGIGFGKTVEHNLMLIKHLDLISNLGFPVLVGPSRKSFIQKILKGSVSNTLITNPLLKNTVVTNPLLKNTVVTNPLLENTEIGTMATVAASIMNGAKIVRVHDVASAKTVANIIDAIKSVN